MRARVYKIEVREKNGEWKDYDGKEYTASDVCHILNGLNIMTYANDLEYRKVFSRVATIYK